MIFLTYVFFIHSSSFYQKRQGESVKGFQHFLQKGEFNDFFGGEARSERGGQFWEGAFRFLETTFINFTSQLSLDLLFTCRLKDVSLVIFHLCFLLISSY